MAEFSYLILCIGACNLYNYELGSINWENEGKLHLNILLVFRHYVSGFSSCLGFTESFLNQCDLMGSLLNT